MNPRNDRNDLDAWGVAHARPGYMTEYERRDENRRRLGDWLPLLIVAVAMLVCLFIYNLPVMLGWLEAGL